MMKFGHLKPQETESLDDSSEIPVYVLMDSGANRFAVNDRKYFDTLDESSFVYDLPISVVIAKICSIISFM